MNYTSSSILSLHMYDPLISPTSRKTFSPRSYVVVCLLGWNRMTSNHYSNDEKILHRLFQVRGRESHGQSKGCRVTVVYNRSVETTVRVNTFHLRNGRTSMRLTIVFLIVLKIVCHLRNRVLEGTGLFIRCTTLPSSLIHILGVSARSRLSQFL